MAGWYVAMMVPSLVGVVAVAVPGCLLGWLGLLGRAACLVLVPGCPLGLFSLYRLCSPCLSITRRSVVVSLRPGGSRL